MKKFFIIALFTAITLQVFAQQVLFLKNGSVMTIQNGIEVALQGGITLENGSNLTNNGILTLKNNSFANLSDWKDLSTTGALFGTGRVVFNSINTHQYFGNSRFYQVQVNTGGISLNNNFSVSQLLHLISGKINTGANHVFLQNDNASSLFNDATNAGYTNSWVNGNFRRLINTNISTYDFPVGNNTRSNLLQFINNGLAGIKYLTASFGPKPGTDAGLNISEAGLIYSGVNNGGVWYLNPDVNPSAGNYSLQLYFTGFNNLLDNQFGILRRPDASSNAADWEIPPGSFLAPVNGLGRLVSDGFARRTNISDFSQLGIGMFVPCEICTPICSYTQGFYSNPKAIACYNNNGTTTSINSTQLMLNAFGANDYQVFGNIANRRFFTLFKTDITNGNISKMLPGFGNSQAIAVDNVLPYAGAFYPDKNTWYLVPIEVNGPQKGKIKNLLLSQLMSLWFNLRTSNFLGTVSLVNDTLVTIAQTSCGSGVPFGSPEKYGLPHSVIVYLNGGNGYSPDVNGLFQFANAVLGGANTSVSATDVQAAVARINEAFDGCRILVRTIPYSEGGMLITKIENQQLQTEHILTDKLIVRAYPNPYDKEFSLSINSPVSGFAIIDFYSSNGAKVHQQRVFVRDNGYNIILYTGPFHRGSLLYSVTIGGYNSTGIIVGPN